MSDEIVSIEVLKLSMTYRSYQADKPLPRLRSCFVLVAVKLHSCLFINGVRYLYAQLEYKVHQNIQPYIFRSRNYEHQNTLYFLSTITVSKKV